MGFPFFSVAGLRLGISLTCTLISFCLSAQNTVPGIRIFPGGGLYSEPTQVTLSNALSDAVLYYTLDGSIPDTNALVYTSPLSIDATTVLRVRAFMPGFTPSPMAGHRQYRAAAEVAGNQSEEVTGRGGGKLSLVSRSAL